MHLDDFYYHCHHRQIPFLLQMTVNAHNLEEIGEVVGVKADAVKVKLFRARKRLGKELELILAGEVQEIL